MKLHIVYIITKLELGGAQKVCLSLCKGMKEKKFSVSLLTGKKGPLVEEVHNTPGTILLETMEREVSFFGFFREIKNFFVLIRELRQLKHKHKNIIVHTHSTKAGIIGRWTAFFAGIKTRIHTVHGFGFHAYQRLPLWFVHYFFELITSFITTTYVCVSEKDRESGEKFFPFFKKKSVLIRAAVSWEKFYIPARKIDESALIIFGTVSCFKPQKNLVDLFRAFKEMHDQLSVEKQKVVFLEVLGDGEMRSLLEAWIQKHDMKEKIILLGWQKEIAPFLKRWNCLVMSSLWEGLPCAIVEARLSKIPAIVYNVGGISEIIHHEKNGFLVAPGDWKRLAFFMKRIVCEKNLASSLGHSVQDLRSFSLESMLSEHKKLYMKIMKSID